MKRYLYTGILVAVLLMMSSASMAQIIPDWYGQPGTTYQRWTFDMELTEFIPPEETDNLVGMPEAFVSKDLFTEWINDPGIGSKTGVWSLGPEGKIDISVGYTPDTFSVQREIWVEVDYLDGMMSFEPGVSVDGSTLISPAGYDLVEMDASSGLVDTWMSGLYKFEQNLELPFDSIQVTSDQMTGSVIDALTVYTRPIPEPVSILLLSFGGLLARKRLA